jgi:hypothetical protein
MNAGLVDLDRLGVEIDHQVAGLAVGTIMRHLDPSRAKLAGAL